MANILSLPKHFCIAVTFITILSVSIIPESCAEDTPPAHRKHHKRPKSEDVSTQTNDNPEGIHKHYKHPSMEGVSNSTLTNAKPLARNRILDVTATWQPYAYP